MTSRLTDADRFWVLTPTGRRLHAPDPADQLAATLCGRPVRRTGRNHNATPRCLYCCHLTGIPTGLGPPIRDARARPHLGIPTT